MSDSFSKRNRYKATKEITIREDAPVNLRHFVLGVTFELERWPLTVLKLLCKQLRTKPLADEKFEEFYIRAEVERLFYGCAWYQVYDFIESLWAYLDEVDDHMADEFRASRFTKELNEFFLDKGIGWQLEDGRIVTRGTEAFEAVITGATAALKSSNRPTAATHLHEALEDLSRRPQADLPGAVYHALGALECVARDLTGDSKATLGEVMKWNPGLPPKPLDEAVPKIWGYASNEARHVVEGREASREEAELLVGLSAVLAGYLTRKQS